MKALAFVGCAHIHTPGFVNEVKRRELPVKYVWDHDAARAQMNAEKTGATVAEIETILADPDVAAVVITSETNRHPALVEAVVEAKKPLFVEKPMGTLTEASRQMAALIEASGLPFSTGYFMRGDKNIRKVKALIEEGFFGQITRVRASNCHSGALGGWFDGEWRWMADPNQAGVGGFGDLGTHVLDILLWLFGEVASATGALSMGTARYPGCDECGEAVLRFKSGIIGTLTASWDDVANPVTLQVAGTKGHAVLGSQGLLVGEDGNLAPAEDLPEPVPAGFNAFLDWFEGKPAELVSPREASNVDATMDAIYTGAREDRWVVPG